MIEPRTAADTELAGEWGAALAEQASRNEPQAYQQPKMETFRPEPASKGGVEPVNIEAILDIPVTLSVTIGKTKISIRNLLQLNQGSVVELDRLAGEPLDVLINGTLVAHGEVVVVNEKFGIRLTDVVSAQERVRKLK